MLRERGEVSNRDFAISDRARVDSYRGRKDSSVALHYLWRTGEAMVTRRERFERVYARPEKVAPARFLREAPEAETDDFLLMKAVAAGGLTEAQRRRAAAPPRRSPRATSAAWKRRQGGRRRRSSTSRSRA